ncbi:MAG: M1 family metallopeptidase [Gammaproteobacteria bacterium]|nr:M1 family metallopeptidase [Gammaproteobacteria bacterium]
MAAFLGSIQLCAFLQHFIDFNIVESFSTVSLLKFLLLTCPVTLSFVAVLSLLFNVLLRNNLLTMSALLGTVIGGYFLITQLSLSQHMLFEGLPLVGTFGSDLDPEQLGILDIVRYSGYFAAVLFLFMLAVVFYRRRDVFKLRDSIVGSVCGLVFVVCLGTSSAIAMQHASKVQLWTDFRGGSTETRVPQIDIVEVSAQVNLNPKHRLTATTELSAIVLTDSVKDSLTLWLNPGFVVSEVRLDEVQVKSEFDAKGALRVELTQPLKVGQKLNLSITYHGKPDLAYGYFDSSTDIRLIPYWDQLLSYMGSVHGIFSSNFVALPQEIAWLPSAFLPLHELRERKDFFISNIELTLPKNWEPALPGTKILLEDDDPRRTSKTYEFTTDTPVSSVGLYAGPLRTLSREISGTNFEILISEHQLNRLGLIGESIDELADALAEQLEANSTNGYEFPCSNYRFVSVPQHYRVYGGGTFLNLSISNKCSYLLREFDILLVDWQKSIPEWMNAWFEREDMTRGAYFVNILRQYFRLNIQGFNFHLDLFNTYWDHEVGIVGPEAEALSLVLSYLNDLFWYSSMDGFSASGYFPKAMRPPQGQTNQGYWSWQGRNRVGRTGLRIFGRVKPLLRHVDLVEDIVGRRLTTEEVQHAALESSIQQTISSDLDPFLAETLRLRCAHLSYQLYLVLGRDDTKVLFDELLARYRHSNFNLEDLYATSADLGLPVKEVLGDWFSGNVQPQLEVSTAHTYKRQVSEDELEEEYQILFHVFNRGEGTGVFRTSVTTEFGGYGALSADIGLQASFDAQNMRMGGFGQGPVVFIQPGESVEVGIVTEREPIRVIVDPLNLKIGGGRVAVPAKVVQDTRNIDAHLLEEFHGFRASDWKPPPPTNIGIVVDDLDPSVSVENGRRVEDVKTWRRVDYPSAWGSSRRTMVYSETKNPKSIAFQTKLPNAGMWLLEFHLPDFRGQFGDYPRGLLPRGRIGSTNLNNFFWQSIAGEYQFTLEAGDVSKVIDVSVSESDFGWIFVTETQLDQGTAVVNVKPSNSDGKLFGDAIRWVQVDTGE